mmetsp:Transcript_9504/g.9834  ORF Transcript_9504/g.9834 Transcript_9504/m.9834 type:complete len:393 (-) Transcript_9504:6-1184(-)
MEKVSEKADNKTTHTNESDTKDKKTKELNEIASSMESNNAYDYEQWYPVLKSYCVWSRFFFLPKEIFEYFESESIITDEAEKILSSTKIINQNENDKETTLLDSINDLVESWDAVFPKINNKAAVDSEFIVPEMKCLNTGEIFTLLKTSPIICEEISKYKTQNKKPVLILKKWYSIPQTSVFRVFFVDYSVKGISQRHLDASYGRNDVPEVKKHLLSFFIDLAIKNREIKVNSDKEKQKHAQCCISLFENCFVDVVVYVDSGKVKILDIEKLLSNSRVQKEEWNKENTKEDIKKEKSNSEIKDRTLLFNLEELINNKGVSIKEYFFNTNKTKQVEDFSSSIDLRIVESVEGSDPEDLNKDMNRFPIELQEFGATTIEELIKSISSQEKELNK